MATFEITENLGTYQGNTSYISDGNTSNCWRADNQQGAGKYVLWTFSAPVTLRTAKYSTTQTQEVFTTGAYFQVSQDGSSWTDIDQFTGSASQTFTVNQVCNYARIYCKSGSNYVSISEMALDFSDYVEVTHTVTLQTGDGITTNHSASEQVIDGSSYSLEIHGTISTITDNGTDVLAQLEEKQIASGGTASSYPTSYSNSGSISGTRYRNCIGKGSATTATGNDYASGNSSATAKITYTFDFSSIPEGATIDSVEVLVGGHAENASRSTATLQLYSGSTAKGSQSIFTSTSKQVVTMTAGTWTRAELQNATLVFTIGYYGGLVNGVDFNVKYSIAGGGETYHVYTLTVNEDHAILINVGETGTKLRVKSNNSWKQVKKLYIKQNGQWIKYEPENIKAGSKFVKQ